MSSDISSNRPPADDLERRRILLIVDDDPRICRALSRRLLSSFDTLRTACTQREAESWLGRERISHLICDYDLGKGVPKGTELALRWRREYPSIERAVLFTGACPDEAVGTFGIDAVICKTADFFELMASLGL